MPTITATSGDLRQLYDRELLAHGYQSDAAQLAAIARLEHLRQRLLTSGTARPATGALGKLLKRTPAKRDPQGIYLWGGVGRGKTWLMDLFFDSLPFKQRRRLHFHHFMRDVHGELRRLNRRRDPLTALAQQLTKELRVLCLDELFVSDIADAMIVGGLLEALLDAGVTLVITSNAQPRQLYRDGLQRARFLPAIALLESRLEVHRLDAGVDYRLRQLRQAPIYLSSADAASAREQMGALFQRLAGEHGEHDAKLRVGGRPIAAWRRSSDVVWFSFASLCEGPRSQNDYAEIADEFHTVFLADVQVFTELQDDAARRFIALVDEFYDRGVKLVLAAAAAPDQLYRGERLRLDFQRAASRLVEMQSEQYLARAHRS
jgi:cell division protein ZapE